MSSTEVLDLAALLNAGDKTDEGSNLRMRRGTVTAVGLTTADLSIGGIDVPGVPFYSHLSVGIGDVVDVLFDGPAPRIIGAPSSLTTSSPAGSLAQVTISAMSLGSVGGGGYIYFDIPVGPSANVWRFVVTGVGATNWDLQVTSEPSGAGELMFQAEAISVDTYTCSWIWRYRNDESPRTSDLHLGIHNPGSAVTFTLDDLRADVWT